MGPSWITGENGDGQVSETDENNTGIPVSKTGTPVYLSYFVNNN
jgi:hypothetical protein